MAIIVNFQVQMIYLLLKLIGNVWGQKIDFYLLISLIVGQGIDKWFLSLEFINLTHLETFFVINL